MPSTARPRPGPSTLRRPIAIGLAALALASAGRLAAVRQDRHLDSIVSVQMHLHGNLSEHGGTWASHTRIAREQGIDVLWWSEHAERLQLWEWEYGLTQSFEPFGTLSEESEGTALCPGDPTGIINEKGWSLELSDDPSFVGEVTDVYAEDPSPPPTPPYVLRLSATSPGAGWQRIAYRYDVSRRRERLPLLADVRYHVALRSELVSDDTVVALRIELADAPNGEPNALVYQLGGPSLDTVNERSVRLDAPEGYRGQTFTGAGTFFAVDLDVTADAAERFGDAPSGAFGDEQAITAVRFEVWSRDGAPSVGALDDLRVEVLGPTGQALHDLQRDRIATSYGGPDDPIQLIGSEQALPPEGQPHLVLYGDHLPLALKSDDPSANVPPLDWCDPLSTREQTLVDWVRAQDRIEGEGMVSYAHPFGPRCRLDRETCNAPCRDEAGVEALAEELIAADAFDVDLLEVGYLFREGSIDDHLDLWDRLSAAGLFVTGVGVTDAHEPSGWLDANNHFVSWVFTPSMDEATLVARFKAGRVFFGDLARVRSRSVELDLELVEGGCTVARMGQAIRLDQPSRLRMRIGGIAAFEPGRFELRLVVDGRTRQVVSIDRQPFTHAVSVPPPPSGGAATVRVEVWDTATPWDCGIVPVLFSNPIYLLDPTAPTPVPVDRLAVGSCL